MTESAPDLTPPPAATGAYAPEESAAQLGRLLDQYLADLHAGRAPDRAALLAAHPELAAQLEQCLAGIDFIHKAGRPSAEQPARLGDFRIVREVGRGGMGVVYEAEQLSLKRKVALKVLRFGAVADGEAMRRFVREAETVARLHHTNIVPIFAVGCEQGVHYYAMQFIEGRSLADVAGETQPARSASDGSAAVPSLALRASYADPREVARWGLQAAEALAHAHQRGVIHRDVKPSNLLLDDEGVLWLTDFGLAKRADEVTLTLTGLLVGTPRYMSPEQAAAAKQPVDHRTDIYSLGATLYELATGRPVFDADSPQGVISQILSADPVSPRRLQAAVPRDLETIILKCLAKEPARRYATAQELAGDLRAFVEGRPIRARRPSLVERAARWARKHRRSTATAAIAAAVAVLLMAGGILGWQMVREARLGRIHFATDGPHLVAEVLDAEEEQVVASFPVPTPEPVALPAGSYRLRLSASGLLSETWPLDVERGEETSYPVRLRHHLAWPPLELRSGQIQQILEQPGRADLVVLDPEERSVRRIDGSTGRPAWVSDLVLSPRNLPAGQKEEEWLNLLKTLYLPGKPSPVRPAPDLDGDGVNDLVLASGAGPSLLAVAGAAGKVLWWFRARPQLPAAAQDAMRIGRVIGHPAVADVDDDGTPDLVALFGFESSHVGGSQTWLEAVSGKTGASLWQHVIGPRSFSSQEHGFDTTCRPTVIRIEGRPVVVTAASTSRTINESASREAALLVGVDLKTGQEVWPAHELGPVPLRAPEFADLDGDGLPEALFLRRSSGAGESATLTALSLRSRSVSWQRPVPITGQLDGDGRSHRQTHLLTDLDGDGKQEVLLPVVEQEQVGRLPNEAKHVRGGAIELLDGATGRARWRCSLLMTGEYAPPAVDRFLAGPDLDGDGCRELFVAATGYAPELRKNVLVVKAISGAAGKVLWQWRHPVAGGRVTPDPSGPLRWWQAGEDGWPLLVVPLAYGNGGQHITFALSAATGRLAHLLPEVLEAETADFNGDGIPELFYPVAPQGAGRLLAVRGRPPEPWRRLGVWRAGQDLDGDGFTDLIQQHHGQLTARSGCDSRVLWRAQPSRDTGRADDPFLTPPPPFGDLDGDGTPDLVRLVKEPQKNYRTVVALSGKDGQPLWTAGDFGMQDGSSSGGGGSGWKYSYPALGWCDLNGDRRAEVLVASSGSNGPELAVLASTDGKLLWKTPFLAAGVNLDALPDPLALADLNGDGWRDLVLWRPRGGANRDGPHELCALSGRDGRRLWPAAALVASSESRLFLWPRPAVGDLDGDGVAEVVVVLYQEHDQKLQGYEAEAHVFDGRDGKKRWTWRWQMGSPFVLPPLLADLDGNGRRSVCLGTWEPKTPHPRLVILDGEGRVRRQFDLPKPVGSPVAWWSCHDLDGDGKEELLFSREGKLWAGRGSTEEVLWTWPLPSLGRIAAIEPAAPGRPAAVVVWLHRDVIALDGPTGRPRWRCEVKEGPPGLQHRSLHLLAANEPPGLPRALVQWPNHVDYSWATLCSQAWPTTPTGEYQPPAPAPIEYGDADSPAWLRPLPWAQRRPNGLLALLAVAVLLVALGYLAARRRWGWVGVVLALAVAVPLLLAAFELWADARRAEDAPRYSWSGWYWAWFSGLNLVALGLVLALPVRLGVAVLKRLAGLTAR